MRQSSLDEALTILSNKHRRRVLVALLNHDPQNDSKVQLPADIHFEAGELSRLQTELHHVHLPKLVDAGIIDWNEETHTVTKGPTFDEIRALLELITEHQDELPGDWR